MPDLAQGLRLTAQWLRASGYRFTTVTPATHARVNARPRNAQARDVQGVFGWSRPFAREDDLVPASILDSLEAAQLVRPHGALLRSLVRFSSLGDALYAHSAYPTTEADAVFFGPDTYRFAALIESELARQPLRSGARIADIGCGAGPGGIASAFACGQAACELVLADINPRALLFARANAQGAGLANVQCVQSDLFQALEGSFDLIVSNPPYLLDPGERTYRHGGGVLGAGLSLRIAAQGMARLAPGGRLVLYTGAAMVHGADPLFESLLPVLQGQGWPYAYRELDPDVFGEELETQAYEPADRIAAVALVVERPRL